MFIEDEIALIIDFVRHLECSNSKQCVVVHDSAPISLDAGSSSTPDITPRRPGLANKTAHGFVIRAGGELRGRNRQCGDRGDAANAFHLLQAALGRRTAMRHEIGHSLKPGPMLAKIAADRASNAASPNRSTNNDKIIRGGRDLRVFNKSVVAG